MSQLSNKHTLVLLTASATKTSEPDSHSKNRTTDDTLITALAGLKITTLELNDEVMNEADWDKTLSAILEHQRCITL